VFIARDRSLGLAFKGIEQLIRQRLEERLRDFQLVLCETDRPLGFLQRRFPFARFALANIQPDTLLSVSPVALALPK
jgi:hypothetical protein